MTRNENRQRIKNEALNNIKRIYDDKYSFPYDEYDPSTPCEQREFAVANIIRTMNYELSST